MRGIVFFLAILASTRAGLAWAQQPDVITSTPTQGLTWSYDADHGTMQAASPAGYWVKREAVATMPVTGEPPSPAQTFTGTVNIAVNVKLVSAVPGGAVLMCTAGAGLEYAIEGHSGPSVSSVIGFSSAALQSTETVEAGVSGNTATCNFSIPYSWTVPAFSSSLTYVVRGIGGSVGISAQVVDNSFAGMSVIRTVRSTSVSLGGPTPVQPNGATTSLSASTVL